MIKHKAFGYWLVGVIFPWLLVFLAGCNDKGMETVISPTTPLSTEAPDNVLMARDTVLEFLRDGANECIPPANVRWQTEPGQAPDGFAVYRFKAEDCLMTVSYALEAGSAEDADYHVTLGDKVTGFCWQASVSAVGRVQATGPQAEMRPELVSAAAAYCQAQGHLYEMRTQPDGRECGVCVYADGSACNAWAYYQHECAPGSIPPNEP